ncbi:MAG TPA: hypothetical protein VLR71_09380 [Casimicrobiaceae bacterium]|nr:hypothetical protein [Casimicrobiaceae bacterium]
MLALHMSYSMCKPVLPQYVLAQDSGAISDQSDANRTPIARVQAFVPLAVTLGRLNAASSASATDPGCPPSCACGPAGQSAGASVGSTGTPSAFAPATGRALLLGFDKALSGANARVLVSVRQESEFDKAAPMQTAVAIGGRFVPVVSSDESRAASETGIVTLAFDTTSTAEALFGGAFHWLRFQPGPGGDDGWAPKLRGVYANAVRASATETLTRELLGSSEGAPNLVVKVARPPVLRDSLELRVREPLGDEDRQALLDADEKKVLTIDDPPGDWVLWTQVADPLDEPPSSRVYALDERTGEIRFGDELHGRIPPVGRDSIVAFRYARTEARPDGDTDVPANRIQARAPISLVSPVTSVDAVFAADQAAGGAPPEPDDRVLQFAAAKLRHRERAVTARDFEDIVLETFPDIAQARMLLDNARARLVVVTQAGEGPNRAQARALRAALLERAPAALASASFEIAQPRIRRVRVDLALRVRTLDVAGDLAGRAKNAVKAFFDVATGGPSGEGFAIGATPRAEDLARAIVDLPDLDGIASIALLETIAGDEKPWSGVVKAAEIVRLADDGVRVAFDLVGAVA